MKTILSLDKLKIECEGIATSAITDYLKNKLDKAHDAYNRACEGLKAENATTIPDYPTVERQWFKFQDWLGTYNVVIELIHNHKEGRKTFPNMSGYVEVIK